MLSAISEWEVKNGSSGGFCVTIGRLFSDCWEPIEGLVGMAWTARLNCTGCACTGLG